MYVGKKHSESPSVEKIQILYEVEGSQKKHKQPGMGVFLGEEEAAHKRRYRRDVPNQQALFFI